MRIVLTVLLFCLSSASYASFAAAQNIDWPQVEEEAMRHFQALLRFDTADPPGREIEAAQYLQRVLEEEGIPVEMYALEEERPNLVARLKGNGNKRPLLIMAHTDTVNVDPEKWSFPPFAASRDGGYVYGRGTVDDKDNVAAALMVMLQLKRLEVPLDRDVIFLAEAGEEGSTRIGIQFMVNEHLETIDSEFCYAEGGRVNRVGGEVSFASVQTLEKLPYAIELTARGVAGHGSVPLQTNSVVRLSKAVAAVADWRSPIRLNETTSTYFERLASISAPELAEQYRKVLSPETIEEADEYFLEHEPRHASMLRSSLSPNIIDAGYRINIIPSESRATVDFRALPDEDVQTFLDEIRKVIDDPVVDVALGKRDTRPAGEARLDTDAFRVIEQNVEKHYETITLPTMSTGATDMAYLRAKGIQCYGVGPAIDIEDGPKGFGAHSDQERILENEFSRFIRFHWDIVVDLAGAASE